MGANGRRVSVYVNESALQAWLTGGKPANTPTPSTEQPSSSRSEVEGQSQREEQKAG